MNPSKSIFNILKERRIQLILNTLESRVLALAWVKRALVITTILSSYLFLFAALIPLDPPNLESYTSKLYLLTVAALVMLSSFALLRKAMRRVTSLPDEYLDERQIANRDWAFRLGYLVVRRTGLGLTLLFFAGSAISWVNSVTIPYRFAWRAETPVYQAERWLVNYVESVLKAGPIAVGFSMFFVLTFVAYSFPLILVSWREAKFATQPTTPVDGVLASVFVASVRRYSWLLAISGGSFLVFLLLWWLAIPPSAVVFLCLFLIYNVYIYFWGLVKIGSAIVELRGRSRSLLWLFISTAVVGASVPVLLTVVLTGMFTPREAFGWYFVTLFVAGFALIPLQAISFSGLLRIAKRMSPQ
jgi:hypothetical protein